MNWEQIIVVVIIGIVILLVIIQAIALIPGNDEPDYQALWQDAEAKRLSQEVEISGYQAQLAYLNSSLEAREKKMSKKVVVEPWFDKFVRHENPHDLTNELMKYLYSRKYGMTSNSFAPFDELTADELADLVFYRKKYEKAIANGYAVKEPRWAFKLPNGKYVWKLEINDDSATDRYSLTDYKIVTNPTPSWQDKDELEYFQKYLVGEVVEEDEDEI
uniref:hypothetical protein n=1 Tax=Lentilactobacillus hilgardii TaxID=1588 RepID=UPI00403FA643